MTPNTRSEHGDIQTLVRLAESRGQHAVAVELRRLADAPPDSDAGIGFYGVEHEPAASRAWLVGLDRAEEAGVIESVEDKYAPEWFSVIADLGWLGRDAAPQNVESFLEMVDELEDPSQPEGTRALRDRLMDALPAVLAEVEAAVAQHGRTLVSFEATDGDTMFFTALTESERVALGDASLPQGVRPFNRLRFADFFSYAVGMRDSE